MTKISLADYFSKFAILKFIKKFYQKYVEIVEISLASSEFTKETDLKRFKNKSIVVLPPF